MFATVLFYVFSALCVVGGLLVITRRDPFESAMALVATFFFLAADFVLLKAPFVALVQVLVYAGAVMVLFLFVIMLLNLRGDEGLDLGSLTPRAIAVAALAVGLGCTAMILASHEMANVPPAQVGPLFGTVAAVGAVMFSPRFLLAVEMISALLTVALVGAVVLARREM